jgi:type VI secretion system protein ImpG
MDPRLTRLYQDELTHLREMGKEFAAEHPIIAKRLDLGTMEVADPYVERLLEGFAFLTARIQLKLEAEQPRLIAQLLESMYPNFLAPVPSMSVMRFEVDTSDPNLAHGYTVPRGCSISSLLPRGQNTRCEFRTAMDVRLWPMELVSAQYFSHAPDLPLTRLPQARPMKGGLRLRLRCGGGLRFDQLDLDRLGLFISAPDDVAFRLHELVLGASLGTLVSPVPATGDAARLWRDADSVRPVGNGDDEALLPETLRAFSGHRLLQEAAAMPQRLLFFELGDLAARLAGVAGNEVDLVLAFQRGDPALEALIDGSSLSLFCTPAINLFPRRLDRVTLGTGSWEYHVVPDRSRPMDLEVHHIDSVVGHGSEGVHEFKPLYSSQHETQMQAHGCYTVRREPRRSSDRQRTQGARVPSYMGEEVFVSLLDFGHGPYRESLRQLSVNAWVTNRDLPVLLPPGGSGTGVSQWQLDSPGAAVRVECLRGPTRPVSRQPAGDVGWKLVSQLTQNHLALGDNAEAAAATLRDTLRLYGPPNDVSWLHQIDGLRSLQARPVVRRLPFAGPLSFGRGTELVLEVDEHSFQGASAFLLGSVLEVYFARHASINSFTQLTLKSAQRGVIKAWPPRLGLRQLA